MCSVQHLITMSMFLGIHILQKGIYSDAFFYFLVPVYNVDNINKPRLLLFQSKIVNGLGQPAECCTWLTGPTVKILRAGHAAKFLLFFSNIGTVIHPFLANFFTDSNDIHTQAR